MKKEFDTEGIIKRVNKIKKIVKKIEGLGYKTLESYETDRGVYIEIEIKEDKKIKKECKYKEGYLILMEYFDEFSPETKAEIDKELKEWGL